jgi:hypothetical protein
MKPLQSLPPSPSLEWSRSDHADGNAPWTAPVTQRPLAQALRGEASGPPPSLLQSLRTLGRSSGSQSMAPRGKLGEHGIAVAKRTEPIQQQVSQLIPQAPNLATSIVASAGESSARYQMSGGNFDPGGQYTRTVAEHSVVTGSAVCQQVNNALFRAIVAAEAHLAEEAQEARRHPGAGRPAARPVPVSFVLDHQPHGYVLMGDLRDPRQADDILVLDSWETLPIVKSWTNTQAKGDYTVRYQFVAGTSAIAGVPLDELQALSARRPSRSAVDAHLQAQGRPPVGPALLKATLAQYQETGTMVFHGMNGAIDPTLVYEAPDGSTFTPTVTFDAYQRLRTALAHPLYPAFMQLNRSE